MTVSVALPPGEDRPVFFRQRLAGLRQGYGDDLAEIRFLCLAENLDHYRRLLPGHSVEIATPEALKGSDAFIGSDGFYLTEAQAAIPRTRHYVLSDQGRIVPAGREMLDDQDYPHFASHPFNWHSPRDFKVGHSCLYFFPYGYLGRAIGHGPLNEFGHRIDFDFRTLIDRPANHIVIALFGGSAAYSTACTYQQMFSQVMERDLNARAQQAGSPLKFTVLNFGTCGAVVLNEMITHMLFAPRLRPDIVISHSGANDFGYSFGASAFLLGGYDMVHQQQFIEWSRMLHEPGYDENTPAEPRPGPPDGPAPPPVVIRAYARRVRQFSGMVRSFGGSFIWGLQPHYLSKPDLSPDETDWIHTNARVPILPIWIRQYYDLLKANMPPLGDDLLVDLDAEFKTHGADETLLSDVIHLDPLGDEVVGRHYAAVIWERQEQLLRRRDGAAGAGTSMGDIAIPDPVPEPVKKRGGVWGQLERLLRPRARV